MEPLPLISSRRIIWIGVLGVILTPILISISFWASNASDCYFLGCLVFGIPGFLAAFGSCGALCFIFISNVATFFSNLLSKSFVDNSEKVVQRRELFITSSCIILFIVLIGVIFVGTNIILDSIH